MNIEQTNIKKKLFIWSSLHNFQLIINFHNMQYQCIKNQVSVVNSRLKSCKDKNERKDLLILKSNLNNTFNGQLKINTFLMMYAHLEEFLYLIWKSFDKTQVINNSGSLKRFKSIVENILQVDLSKDREWELLCDYEKIRDCILHANCRVSISRNNNDLRNIISKSCKTLILRKDRIELSGEFLIKVSNTIESLLKLIENISKS